MFELPRPPDRLRLPLERAWDGAPAVSGFRGWVELAAARGGLWIGALLEQPTEPREPPEPRGTRIDGLWEWDVVECFLVGAGGRYFELELGAGGHFLALSFSAPRRRSHSHEGLALDVWAQRGGRQWRAETVVPREILPPGLCAVNVFAIAAGRHLAHHPVPGDVPDFHQPAAFPALRVPADW
jgi:hypothetical protein